MLESHGHEVIGGMDNPFLGIDLRGAGRPMRYVGKKKEGREQFVALRLDQA